MDIRGFGDLLGEEAFLYPVKRSKYRAKRLSWPRTAAIGIDTFDCNCCSFVVFSVVPAGLKSEVARVQER